VCPRLLRTPLLRPSATKPAIGNTRSTDQPVEEFTSWQPVQSLVSQQVTGAAEWFETGTLVFGAIPADSQQTSFYYNCAEDNPGGQPGIAVP